MDYPKTLYVAMKKEIDSDDEWLHAAADCNELIDSVGSELCVGEYELVGIVRLTNVTQKGPRVKP
jgi:hypothetical protein